MHAKNTEFPYQKVKVDCHTYLIELYQPVKVQPVFDTVKCLQNNQNIIFFSPKPQKVIIDDVFERQVQTDCRELLGTYENKRLKMLNFRNPKLNYLNTLVELKSYTLLRIVSYNTAFV